MKLSKKHFELVAELVAKARQIPCNDSLSVFVQMTADRFEKEDRRFDKRQFFLNCSK